jgi:transposase InsO family protein
MEDERLGLSIESIHRASRETYGSPRIQGKLKEAGVRVGRKRVERLMRERGLQGRSAHLYHRKVKTRAFYSAIPNRSVGVEPTGPDQVWAGDITYLKVSSRWLYLAVVMDMFSRRIVGWSLSHRKGMELTLAAFNRAVANREPDSGLIFHTDRGIEYGAYAFRERLVQLGIIQSMNRPRRMTDNSAMESFFHSLKSDEVHGRKFATTRSIERCVRSYMPFYNGTRSHSSLGLMSPREYERTRAGA